MIVEHHRIRSVSFATSPLVELFRRADLVDFSRGFFRFGLPWPVVAEVMREFLNAGFHRMLVRVLPRGWYGIHSTRCR